VDFNWNRSETIAVAKESCVQCQGVGLRDSTSRKGTQAPCKCVFRGIFRACYTRFRQCLQKEKKMSHVRFELIGGQVRRPVWGRKDEEYVADFCLVSKRFLEESEYRLFRYHFLLGADWKLCCRQLQMDKGQFFHSIYRIQQKLGRAFRELEPYPLFPLDEYFGPTVRKRLPKKVLQMPEVKKSRAVRPPLRKVA
jgi:hypothetical protein